MKYVCIIVLFFSIAGHQNTGLTTRNYIPFNISTEHLSPQVQNFYKSIITGNKKNLNKETVKLFQQYGLLHLLTPSGLHLSSLFFVFILPNPIQIFILSGILLFIIPFHSYFSLERVLLFRIINLSFKKSIFISFFSVIIISLMTLNFLRSPLSLAFSVLFWGTVLCFRKNKWQLFFALNLSLYISTFIIPGDIKLLSILVNPLITSLTTIIFPILLINFILGGTSLLNKLIELLLSNILELIEIIELIDFSPSLKLSPVFIIMLIILLLSRKFKVYIISFLLISPLTQQSSSPTPHSTFFNLTRNDHSYIIKKTKIDFIDHTCKFKLNRILCKKKSSHLGGPRI